MGFRPFLKGSDFFFNVKQKLGETDPIAKPLKVRKVFSVNAAPTEFSDRTIGGTFSFWVSSELKKHLFKAVGKNLRKSQY